MNLLQDKIPQDAAALDAYRDVLVTTVSLVKNVVQYCWLAQLMIGTEYVLFLTSRLRAWRTR